METFLQRWIISHLMFAGWGLEFDLKGLRPTDCSSGNDCAGSSLRIGVFPGRPSVADKKAQSTSKSLCESKGNGMVCSGTGVEMNVFGEVCESGKVDGDAVQ